jgi:hypothetical protein
MPRRDAAATQADEPSNVKNFLRSTIVTDRYHALFRTSEQSITLPFCATPDPQRCLGGPPYLFPITGLEQSEATSRAPRKISKSSVF